MGLFSWFQEIRKRQERKNQKLLNPGEESKTKREYDDSEANYKEIGILYEEVLKEGKAIIRMAEGNNHAVNYYATWEWSSEDNKRNHIILGEIPNKNRESSMTEIATQINTMMEYKYKEVTADKKIVKIQEKDAYLQEMRSIERYGGVVFGEDGKRFLDIHEAGPTIIKKELFIPFATQESRTQIQETKDPKDILSTNIAKGGGVKEKYALYTPEQQQAALSIVLSEQDKKGREEIEEGKMATKVILAVNGARPEELTTLLKKNQYYFSSIMKTQRYDIYERYIQMKTWKEKEDTLKGMLEYAKDTYIHTHESAIRKYEEYVISHHLEEPIYGIIPKKEKEDGQKERGEEEKG